MEKVITTEALKEKMDKGEGFHLIDVLSEESFKARHLPGAKNVPEGLDFVKKFEELVGSGKDDLIITYCSSQNCTASVRAAQALEKAGYTNVVHYKDGIAGWQNAGYEFESSL